MHARPDPRDVWLYQRAVLVKAFPGAYTLATAREAGLEALWALQLLDVAAKVESASAR